MNDKITDAKTVLSGQLGIEGKDTKNDVITGRVLAEYYVYGLNTYITYYSKCNERRCERGWGC